MDFVKWFKQNRDIIKSQIGTGLLDQYCERKESYKNETDDDKKKEMKYDEWNKLMAFCLLRSVDQNKYGSLVKGLSQQFALGNNQYPKDITSATDALSTHRFDQKYYENRKKNNEKNRQNEQKNEENNKSEGQEETSFNQSQKGMTCYCCGEKDHSSNNCPMKDKIP